MDWVWGGRHHHAMRSLRLRHVDDLGSGNADLEEGLRVLLVHSLLPVSHLT